MNRTQKKCLIATAGGHLLLIAVLVFGSAFFMSRSKVDETQVLTILPDNVVDGANSGVRNAQLPAPTPNPPQPEPPKPTVTPPPQPQPQPKPEPVKPPDPEPVKPPKLTDTELKPVDKGETPVKPQPKKIEISLKPVVKPATNSKDTAAAAEAQRQAKLARDRRDKAFRDAMNNISQNTSSATEIEMPGEGSEAYADYASYVKTIYERAWIVPDDASSDDADVKVSITIARSGKVISAKVVDKSGDARMDASVRRALDRVESIGKEFPASSKDSERTFIINFNLKTKRMLG